jgi:hypothetical protein
MVCKNKMANEPSDKALYSRVKTSVYRKYPKHSAYRSGLLVQAYKRAFQDRYGTRRSPYKGSRSRSRSRSRGLGRWFAERWRNQRGEVGYKYKSDVYRPTRRVTSRSPSTFRELSPRRLNRARSQKRKTGRVKQF